MNSNLVCGNARQGLPADGGGGGGAQRMESRSAPGATDQDSGRHGASRLIGSAGLPTGHVEQCSGAVKRLNRPRALINPFDPARLYFQVWLIWK